MPVAVKLPFLSTEPVIVPPKLPLNVPCTFPIASTETANEPFTAGVPTVSVPVQLPLNAPWKGLPGVVVGISVEVTVVVAVTVAVRVSGGA